MFCIFTTRSIARVASDTVCIAREGRSGISESLISLAASLDGFYVMKAYSALGLMGVRPFFGKLWR